MITIFLVKRKVKIFIADEVLGGLLLRYWAEITPDEITFYSEEWLAKNEPELFKELKEKRNNWGGIWVESASPINRERNLKR